MSFPSGRSMAHNCPDCGGTLEYVPYTTRVLAGTCAACGHSFSIVPGESAAAADSNGGDASVAPGAPPAPAPVSNMPECPDCGSSLRFQAAADGAAIEAVCADCEATFTYRVTPIVAEAPEEPFRPRRARPEREGDDRGPTTARPCRECGGPLRFSTNEDGTVQGQCSSCGNRFTLPPRREGPGFRSGGGGRGFDRRGPRPRFGGGGGYSRGGGRGGPRRFDGPPRAGYRPRPREGPRDDDSSDDRRRRRPRRE